MLILHLWHVCHLFILKYSISMYLLFLINKICFVSYKKNKIQVAVFFYQLYLLLFNFLKFVNALLLGECSISFTTMGGSIIYEDSEFYP